MAERMFDLPETRGSFQCKGKINGVAKDKFYTSKATKTGKDFRAVNFGCEYDDKKSIYMSLNGMPQANVYFSKKNDNGKTETKKVAWVNRNNFNEEGFRMIGVSLGLKKTVDANGKEVNDRKTMAPFDACEYIKGNMRDEMSTFIRGNIEFSSYFDKDDNIRRSIKYVPNQISLCKEVNFDEYDEDSKPVHDFTQTIVFMEINKEEENGKTTGRFVVSAKIVTYSDIVDTEFIITDAKLANLFRTKLKPYTSISVHGRIEVFHKIEESDDDDAWGESNVMNTVAGSTKTELIITGATPSTIDKDSYNEKNVSAAVAKIRNARTAEKNFGNTSKGVAVTVEEEDDWSMADDDSENAPW